VSSMCFGSIFFSISQTLVLTR